MAILLEGLPEEAVARIGRTNLTNAVIALYHAVDVKSTSSVSFNAFMNHITFPETVDSEVGAAESSVINPIRPYGSIHPWCACVMVQTQETDI